MHEDSRPPSANWRTGTNRALFPVELKANIDTGKRSSNPAGMLPTWCYHHHGGLFSLGDPFVRRHDESKITEGLAILGPSLMDLAVGR